MEYIIRFLFVKILHVELSADKMKGMVEFVKFGIVGLSNTLISYVIYVAFLLILQSAGILGNIDYLIAQMIAFVLSVLWSFYWNNKYVFDADRADERSIFKALLKTYVSYAFTGLFLNSALSVLWVHIFGMNKMFAPIINLLISVPLNFILNKFWAFR